MNLKGYIFGRPFLGERAPQHIQNIILQDYCRKKSFNLLLSATEYAMQRSSLILFELIDDLKKYDGIIFYSLLQLPEEQKIRIKLYKKILLEKKSLHFAVENILVNNKEGISRIENIFLMQLMLYEKNHEDRNSYKKLGSIKKYLTTNHKKTSRNYLERMNNNKIHSMKIAKKYSFDYWDGDRQYGYGGYRYIKNYHKLVAQKLIKDYSLNKDSKILDIGCGKGFLIYEIKKILNCKNIYGSDISKYAIKNCKREIKKNIFYHDVRNKLDFADSYFDLVISINTLHNIKLPKLFNSLKEIERVGKSKFICVESYRNEKEQFNLECWALTAETIIDKESWLWLFKQARYTGDFEFIYFE